MRKTWMVWLGCGVLALVMQMGCKPSSEPTNAETTTKPCPSPDAAPNEAPAEGSLGTGSQALCEQLANTYAMVTEAHKSCSTDADCGVYPEIGLCGETLNTQVPGEHLTEIHELQVGYACPLPMAKCMPQAERAVCVANVCERG
jgi:hypothetical protein